MQELTFEQVDVVSGGSKIDDMARARAAREAAKELNDSNGSNGSTVAGGLMGGSLAIGGVSAPNPFAKVITGVGVLAAMGFGLSREGRDGMRVQNHPATRDLYNADGSLK